MVIDADLQDPPELIPNLITRLADRRHDIVDSRCTGTTMRALAARAKSLPGFCCARAAMMSARGGPSCIAAGLPVGV
jgi:hypothetical protein